ncbi:GNAT family N-acetyltransferase [Streptomyces canus]|uniref:GNAT family N-acetyltransferase n=1 Tax=Streptomyces canus TaxID=58343 RepID=UPI0030DFF2C5
MPVAGQTVALIGLYAGGGGQVATVVLLMLLGASVGPLFMATQSQVLHVAPGRTETALAANSAAFNVGVAVGALLGGALLPLTGTRGTLLAGGLLTAVALVMLSLHMDCLFLLPGHRGLGLGVLLMDAVAAEARALGLDEVQWQTPVWNDGAIRFYDRMGARARQKVRYSLPVAP